MLYFYRSVFLFSSKRFRVSKHTACSRGPRPSAIIVYHLARAQRVNTIMYKDLLHDAAAAVVSYVYGVIITRTRSTHGLHDDNIVIVFGIKTNVKIACTTVTLRKNRTQVGGVSCICRAVLRYLGRSRVDALEKYSFPTRYLLLIYNWIQIQYTNVCRVLEKP